METTATPRAGTPTQRGAGTAKARGTSGSGLITRGWAIVLILLTLFALGVRLWNLDGEPPHVDELKQMREVQAPIGELTGLSYLHAQPPLDYYVGKAAVTVGGANDFAQRLPSAVFGSLALGLAGLILIRFEYPWAGAGTVAFGAVTPTLLEYSQYARPYALPLFLVVAAIAIYQQFRLRGFSWWTLIGFAAVSSLAVLSRALMPFLALAVLGFLGLIAARTQIGRWSPTALIKTDPLALIVLPGVAVFVWLPSFIALRHYAGNYITRDAYQLWERLALAVERFGDFGERALQPLSLIVMLAAVVAAIAVPITRRGLVETVWLWLPILSTPLLFAIAHSLTTREGQFFATRYMVFLPLGVLIVISVAIESLIRGATALNRRLGMVSGISALALLAVVAVAPMASASYTLLTTIKSSDWPATAAHIEAIESPGDVIVTIDTRPFRPGAWEFGWEARGRYYDGTSSDVRPMDIINGKRDEAVGAGRYHFVLFVPRVSGEALPEDWQVVELFGMTIATTPPLASDDERTDAWWVLANYLRPDVAVMTQLAGLSLENEWTGRPFYDWEGVILEQAEEMNLKDLALSWLEKTSVDS